MPLFPQKLRILSNIRKGVLFSVVGGMMPIPYISLIVYKQHLLFEKHPRALYQRCDRTQALFLLTRQKHTCPKDLGHVD